MTITQITMYVCDYCNRRWQFKEQAEYCEKECLEQIKQRELREKKKKEWEAKNPPKYKEGDMVYVNSDPKVAQIIFTVKGMRKERTSDSTYKCTYWYEFDAPFGEVWIKESSIGGIYENKNRICQ